MNIVVFIFVMLAVFNSWNMSTVLQDRSVEEYLNNNQEDANYFNFQSKIWNNSAWIIAVLYAIVTIIAANAS